MANELYPKDTNFKLDFSGVKGPENLVPKTQQQFFGPPPIAPENENSTPSIPRASIANMASSRETARFVPSPSPAALPPDVTTPSIPTNKSGGYINVEGTGARATIDSSGNIVRNVNWKDMAGNQGGMFAPQYHGIKTDAELVNPSAPSGMSSGGEVWGGQDAQAYRQNIGNLLKQALANASAPWGGTNLRGLTNSNPGIGHRGEWAALAGRLADMLGTSFSGQANERTAREQTALNASNSAYSRAIAQAKLPAELNEMEARAKYYGTQGEAAIQNVAAREAALANQMEIAKLKSGTGKYGDLNTNMEYLKNSGISASPQVAAKFAEGNYIVAKGQPGKKNRFSADVPAVKPHIVPRGWTPQMDANGNMKILNGQPVYKDEQGQLVTPPEEMNF